MKEKQFLFIEYYLQRKRTEEKLIRNKMLLCNSLSKMLRKIRRICSDSLSVFSCTATLLDGSTIWSSRDIYIVFVSNHRSFLSKMAVITNKLLN